jgi:hypothetical protein
MTEESEEIVDVVVGVDADGLRESTTITTTGAGSGAGSGAGAGADAGAVAGARADALFSQM